jgi:hypothetical protein
MVMAEPKKRTSAKKKTMARKRPPRPRAAPAPSIAELLAELTVESAVRRDLEQLGKRDADLAISALAANALQLAREMDSKTSATSKSMCARALNETLEKLRALAPPEEKPDAVDELLARRVHRIATREKRRTGS